MDTPRCYGDLLRLPADRRAHYVEPEDQGCHTGHGQHTNPVPHKAVTGDSRGHDSTTEPSSSAHYAVPAWLLFLGIDAYFLIVGAFASDDTAWRLYAGFGILAGAIFTGMFMLRRTRKIR